MLTLFEPIQTTNILTAYLISAGFAFLCGVIAALTASFHTHISKSFLISLVILPVIVQTVIMMVNGNVGTGIAVAGAFSLVRFRSVPGRAREIAAIFLAMTAGLACASGYVAVALLFTLLTGGVILLLSVIPIHSEREWEMRITVPESLNYVDAFDDIFETYTKSARLIGVRTTNMGSLYRLDYRIRIKDASKSREMIDELRCRNGNLEIRIATAAERSEEL
jgi:hypothetical protein